MQRIKPILKDALLYFFQIVVYIWPTFLIGNLLVGLIVSILVNNQNDFLVRLSITIACILILSAFLFVYAYRRGHKKAEFHFKSLSISLILALGMQLLYAIIFRFAEYTNSGAYYLAHMLYAGSQQSMTFAYDEVPAYMYIMTMCIIYVFYVAAVISGEYLGKKKRLEDRAIINLDEKA